MAQVRYRSRGREYDIRSMLIQLGLGDVIATLIIPSINFLPRTTDPDSPPVMMLVQGIQKNLNKMGCKLPTDGFMGPETARCIATISGKGWYDKTWTQIVGDILDAKQNGFRFGKQAALSLGAEEEEPKTAVQKVPAIVWIGGVVLLGAWMLKWQHTSK